MGSKRPWPKKPWKGHISSRAKADDTACGADESGSATASDNAAFTSENETAGSGTMDSMPNAARQLYEAEAINDSDGIPNAAKQLYEAEADNASDEALNAAQRLYESEAPGQTDTGTKHRLSRHFIAAAAALAVLLLAVAPATYSYLTASSETVINTFAGGAISIKLDEALVDTDGNPVGSTRVVENSYKITPGAEYTKDPTITVLAGSEDAYIFIYVDNVLPSEYFSLDYSDSWIAVATTGTKTLYVYNSIVTSSDEDITLDPIFTTVTVSADITSEQIEALGEVQLTVQSYAVQAEGVDQETAIEMAAAFFESEFEFSFDDVDTSIDISGVSSGDEESSSSEDTSEQDTSDGAVTADETSADDSSTDGSASESVDSGTSGDTSADDGDSEATDSGTSDDSESEYAGDSSEASQSLTTQSAGDPDESADATE